MVALLPLLSLATVVLAAPPMADLLVPTTYGMRVADDASDDGSDMSMADYGSEYGSEAEVSEVTSIYKI